MTKPLDLAAARAWIADSVGPGFVIELQKERAWATVLRVTAGEDTA